MTIGFQLRVRLVHISFGKKLALCRDGRGPHCWMNASPSHGLQSWGQRIGYYEMSRVADYASNHGTTEREPAANETLGECSLVGSSKATMDIAAGRPRRPGFSGPDAADWRLGGPDRGGFHSADRAAGPEAVSHRIERGLETAADPGRWFARHGLSAVSLFSRRQGQRRAADQSRAFCAGGAHHPAHGGGQVL